MLVVVQKERIANIELLQEGISKCKAYIAYSTRKNSFTYFYGGGFFDKSSFNIVLNVDYIRPNRFKIIDTRDIVHVMYDGEHCDILFKSGAWISGVVFRKIKGAQYDYLHRRFMDERIVAQQGNVKVVDLLSIQPTLAEQNSLYSAHTPSKKLLNHPNPLTFAYIDCGGEVRIGYWDMINSKFVGGIERMEMPLDKSG